MKLLCCDGPLNGQYHEMGGLFEFEDGDQIVVFSAEGNPTYEVATWPTGERVLIHAATKAEVEDFEQSLVTDDELPSFEFTLADRIRDAVNDAEVR